MNARNAVVETASHGSGDPLARRSFGVMETSVSSSPPKFFLLVQRCSGFHRGLGRGRCILGCLRRLSRSCLSGLKALTARLRGGGVLAGFLVRLELEVDMVVAVPVRRALEP